MHGKTMVIESYPDTHNTSDIEFGWTTFKEVGWTNSTALLHVEQKNVERWGERVLRASASPAEATTHTCASLSSSAEARCC